MGSKNKLKRFRENETFKNVIQPDRVELEKDLFHLKGNWNKFYFKNNKSIILELGCGKGEYTIHLAKLNPKKNFIGIDIKGARLWRGAKNALKDEMNNVAFIRAHIELIDRLFAAQEVKEIWITFPDPQKKFKRTKHRLTNPVFLELYRKVLFPNGIIHLKTDSEFLHGYTLGVLNNKSCKVCYAHHDIYKNSNAPEEAITIQTFYEKIYLDQKKPITYIKFKFT